ncbi:hypothetical protein [Proteiniborus sp.]|uniref:hypothetical protein n=1 Tax=Proteiniborus sp. TaxID=2079015 RepID=UPI00332BEE82
MNTQGWIRGYIAHNSSTDKFINLILTTISKEFGYEFQLNETIDDFIISIDKYEIIIDKETAKKLQKRSPYALDKYILNILQEQGLEFDKKRSQYVRYCYDIFEI